jgi:hypothetical protein
LTVKIPLKFSWSRGIVGLNPVPNFLREEIQKDED